MNNTIPLLLILLSAAASWADISPDIRRLEQARLLFYASIQDKKKIEPAIAAFEKIIRTHPEWEGRAQTYVGALMALKGKHSFFPHDKWRWANHGLKIMDEGIAKNPNDVEALFIHSSTCYFLPFFFKRGEDAQNKFRQILQLLPEKQFDLDRQLLKNVLQFIVERAHLSPDERAALESIKSAIELGTS